jgi:hypothetical protein
MIERYWDVEATDEEDVVAGGNEATGTNEDEETP